MTVNRDDYSAATSLGAYYPNRTTDRIARLWQREIMAHNLADFGIIDFFEGSGVPTALPGYAKNKLWLRVEAGITSESGSIRYYAGGDENLIASWPILNRDGYRATLGLSDFATRTAAIAAAIASGVAFLRTAGYATVGDGGGALYKSVGSEPSHAGKFQSADGGWWELDDVRAYNIRMFGGGLLGIEGMAAAAGFVRFPPGDTAIGTNTTIVVPVYFLEGAYVTIQSGVTLTLNNRIDTTRQWIFRGDGDVRVTIVTPTGEDARRLHVSWFGVFPENTATGDKQPLIQKALNAFTGQTREGILQFDQGSYYVYSGITVPRGIHVAGLGTRRTIFDVVGTGYDVFTAQSNAVKFSGIQFEQPSGSVAYRTGALIRIADGVRDVEIDDVWLWNSQYGILDDGINTKISNINATFGASMPEDTAMILLRGAGASVDNVRQMSSGHGPAALVDIGTGATSNFGNILVTNVQTSAPTIPVRINATIANVSNIAISNVIFSGSGSNSAAAVVQLQTSGTAGIEGVTINNVIGSALASKIIDIDQGSSGITQKIVIGGVVATGNSGTGIAFTRSNGTLRDIYIGDTVYVKDRATPFEYSGTITKIKISPISLPNANSAECYTVTIPDDGVAVITPRRTIFSGSAILTGASNVYGLFFIRVASSPNVVSMGALSNLTLNSALGVLNGTTGVDGEMTVSTTATDIYIENRRGSSSTVNFVLLAGA